MDDQGATQIAFGHQSNIWTIDPVTGNTGALHLKLPAGSRFEFPAWSPDSSFVVFKEYYSKGFKQNYRIGVLPAQGANKHIDLTGNLDLGVIKRPIAWVSNVIVE